MTYWLNDQASATNTAELLRDGNGQCGAWAELLKDVLAGLGITSTKITVLAVPDADGFLVKDWTFVGIGLSPGTDPYRWILGVDALDSPNGAPGQGNPNPPGGFYNHFILRYGNAYYDPSYGGPVYASQMQWENASLDGFFRDEASVTVAKKNDPNVMETIFV